MEYFTTKDIALDLGLHIRTIRKYCQIGFLPMKQVWISGNCIYRISHDDYLEWKHLHFHGIKKEKINRYNRHSKDLLLGQIIELTAEWFEWCLTGKLTGKPISKRTVEIYQICFKIFLDKLGSRPSKPLISVENARKALGLIPIESFSTRHNTYSALQSFSKFLIEKELLEPNFRESLKKLKPRRFLPPRKTSLTQDKLERLLREIDLIQNYGSYNRITAKTLITFLSGCGLRNAELCNLKLNEVDLNSRIIYINLGKGNKNRKVGIPNQVYEVLVDYLKLRLKQFPNNEYDNFFLNKSGTPFTTQVLSKKIKRLAAFANVDITPHGLRRTFASLYSASGKPLNHLRIALGHADLSTTQSYIMTTESEVVDAMRDW